MLTLIAAGRLDESLIGRAREVLGSAGIAVGALRWIDEGDAAELRVRGNRASVRAAIEHIDGLDCAVIAGERVAPRLFVADMDSTMIGQECIDELADYAGVKADVAAITERAMRGELDFAGALGARVALLKGLDHEAIALCRAERIRPNPGAATLVATLKARGVTTMLVSGGFTDFVGPIAAELGFDGFAANQLEEAEGKLTGVTVGALVDGEAKRRIAREMLSERQAEPGALVAIGDGANDIPMVELAGLGVGYRPKAALARVAEGAIRHHDLTALLWMLGIPRAEWVS